MERRVRCFLLGDEIGIPALVKIVKTLDWQIAGYDLSTKTKNCKSIEFLKELGPAIDIRNIKEATQFLITSGVELVLMFSFDKILRKDILIDKKVKFVNIHGGKIPEYAGANVLNWAILNGEVELGVTVHEVIEAVDAGAHIGKWTISIDPHDDALTVRENLIKSVLTQLPALLQAYMQGSIKPTKIDFEKIVYWPRRSPQDGIFDFDKTDTQIFNLVRALVDPWPGARFINPNGTEIIFKHFLTLESIKKMRLQYQKHGYIDLSAL
jgi:methionyl-tRNA formyltransferase